MEDIRIRCFNEVSVDAPNNQYQKFTITLNSDYDVKSTNKWAEAV
jgi:hypothetical protein